MAGQGQGDENRGGGMQSPLKQRGQRQVADNAGMLGDLAGKVWNLPNTAIGLGYGLAGYAAGQLNRLRPGDQPNDPRIQFGNNAVEFVNNPLGGGRAVTLGNSITYRDDPSE